MKKTVLILLLFSGLSLFASAPVMKIGVITDTHVKLSRASAFLVGEAYKLFRMHNVDAVINCGDIADRHNAVSYKFYRDVVSEAYGNQKLPLEFFAYANHDIGRNRKISRKQYFADVKKHLKIFHDPESISKFKGYNFVTVQQSVDMKTYEDMIVRAVKDTPDKPVFLIDHIPAGNTVYDSSTWGSAARRAILDKYPQIVQLSGHVHGTLANELNIWQGNFTAVNAGGLAYWHAVLLGNIVATRYSDMALVIEVYKDKLVMRRYFCRSKREYNPNTPWVVQLPYDASKAVYSPEKRKASSTAPEFPADAKVSADVSDDGVQITFTPARHQDGIFYYKMELLRKENGKYVRFSRCDVMGDFDLDTRPETMKQQLNPGYFDQGKEYMVRITPYHIFGKCGKAITGTFAVGRIDRKSTVVFESFNPMKDCRFLESYNGNTPVKLDADGYYDFKRVGRLVFPDDAIWAGDTYTRFRVTVQMHAKQGRLRWTLTMRNPKPVSNGNNRFYTEPGDNGVQRYVFDMYKSRPDYKYYLLIREGSPGKVRFDYIKIERLNEKFSRRKKKIKFCSRLAAANGG